VPSSSTLTCSLARRWVRSPLLSSSFQGVSLPARGKLAWWYPLMEVRLQSSICYCCDRVTQPHHAVHIPLPQGQCEKVRSSPEEQNYSLEVCFQSLITSRLLASMFCPMPSMLCVKQYHFSHMSTAIHWQEGRREPEIHRAYNRHQAACLDNNGDWACNGAITSTHRCNTYQTDEAATASKAEQQLR
jgi:hypothetical protein